MVTSNFEFLKLFSHVWHLFPRTLKVFFVRIAPDLFKQRLLNPIYVSKRKKYYLLKKKSHKSGEMIKGCVNVPQILALQSLGARKD